MRSHGSWRKVQEAIRFYSSSSSSGLLEFLNTDFPSTIKIRGRREFARLLQLRASDDPLLYHNVVHGQIIVSGFESDTYLSNILMNLYSKAGGIVYVRKVFEKISDRNLVTWSTMVSACNRHGFYEESLVVFLEFWRTRKNSPNEYILSSFIQACSKLDSGGRSMVFQLHCFLFKSGFDGDVYVGTSLIDFYLKKSDIDNARLVFDALPEKSTVTWTTMINGYAKMGRSYVSLQLFYQLLEGNVVPDGYILSTVLSACSILSFIEGGKQIHAHIFRHGHEMDASLMNVLIDSYMKCGRVTSARKLFNGMWNKNIISWTTIMSGYTQNSHHKEAMELFSGISKFGLKPDMYACSSILTSCASLLALEYGKHVHAYVVKANLGNDSYVTNSLIDMYSKSDCLNDARKVFDLFAADDVVLYNAMIEGYSRLGTQCELHEALDIFRDMRSQLIRPSLLTFVSLLRASASLKSLELSQQIHGLMFKYGVNLDIYAGSALIDVYSNCYCLEDSRLVFDEMKEKDLVVWNSMFSRYVQQSDNEEALILFSELQLSRERPDEFTFADMVTAAGNLASLQLGQEFHCQIIKRGLECYSYITNSLVDMYSKCGIPEDAYKAFNSAASRDVVCWNSVISSYAHHGEGRKALRMLERMMNEGIEPNYITFVGVLSACSHAGLVEDGVGQFEIMLRLGIEPETEHYVCMVSLLSRAGRLNEARELIEKMQTKPPAIVWRSLLSGCEKTGNIELAEHAAEMAISSDPMDSGSFILLSNVYASKGMWAEAKRVREIMKFDGVVKEPGRSWIEINKELHIFVSKDKSHRKTNQIYEVLDDLLVQTKGFS
ncbi:hypothetical protein EUTSA_v10027184mg [Eutrema salsugineum]|uniref:Pentacotripeptide-repeat region of PRORP domain-containing protein n=1 Tax=Eutrema salsugineum TaxID=72664 RepID=V4LRI8_EUTSA|nr:pentatricopeptide repeat-containing protein At4g39530 [Eutrema salsugineum]ESQ53205.1 hypothetical protein EUTSA_v10027184mg [Eutrema salsugineum]